MKKIIAYLLVSVFFIVCGCDKSQEENQDFKPIPAVQLTVPKVEEKAVEMDTEKKEKIPEKVGYGESMLYRKVFNKVAAELFGFQWLRDDANVGEIDVEAGELFIPDSKRELFGQPPEGYSLTPELLNAIGVVKSEIEKRRKELVKKAVRARKDIHLYFYLASLSPPERQAAKFLIDAASSIHEIFKLQVHPKAPEIEAEIMSSGEADSIRLFERNAGPMCGRYVTDIECSASRNFPAVAVGEIMWPEGLSESTFESLRQKLEANDPVLSPFTVVRKSAEGEFSWVSYGTFDAFRPHLEKIAANLRTAAGVEGMDPTFVEQLNLQAEALLSSEARPFDASDEAWVKSKGKLELTIGPYETYEDRFGLKATYQAVVGVLNEELTKLIEKTGGELQKMEEKFAALIGANLYAPRRLSTESTLKVIDVIYASGDQRRSGGATLAYILPNVGKVADEGLVKRIIMANHHKAKEPILKAIAEIAIVPDELRLVQGRSFMFDSTFHELFHGVGPQRETEVGSTEKKPVYLLLGKYYSPLEEAKAEVGGIWSAAFYKDAGLITDDELKSLYATHLAGLFRQMRFGLEEAHGQGAAMEFAYLFEKGALSIDGGRFRVVFEKMNATLGELLGRIGKIQATGDVEGAKALVEGYPKKVPYLVEEINEKIRNAGVPNDVAIYYHVE